MRKLLTKSFILFIALSIVMTSFNFSMITYAANPNQSASGLTSEISYLIKYKDVEKGKKDLLQKNKKIYKSFKHLPVITTSLTGSDAEQLKSDPNIEYIEKDNVVRKTADFMPDNFMQIFTADAQDQGLTGSGVRVAVLDTGIDKESTELQIVGGASFVPTETTYDDLNGHGTFVAGVIAAIKDNQGFIGVSPNVDLYAVKVLDKFGNGTYSQVIEAIDWAIDNQMDIVNMSFAGHEFSYALQEAMQQAYNAGILLISTTGNEGIANAVGYPAKYATVIAVGAVDGSNQHASFSNTGEEVELVAPGVNIQGLSLNSSYVTLSGTSMAAPHVAGVAALIKQSHPTYTNKEIRQVLSDTAIPLGDSLEYGSGLVDATGAFQANPLDHIVKKDKSKPEKTGIASERIKKLIATYSVTQEFIQAELDKGYTLVDIEEALQIQKERKLSYQESINKVHPKIVNLSKKVKSKIKSDLPEEELKANPQGMVSATAVDSNTLNNVTIKPDQAPYSVNLDNEQISTLSGSLSISATDFTLTGRNGLSFSLTRTYDSSSAQFFEMGDNNATTTPYEETLFPIGKGWTWNLSSVESKYGKQYLHLGGGGTYEISGTTLIGYPWQDLTFTTDTSVTVNGVQSSTVLKSTQLINQYFGSDGRLIQISDAYGNKLQFHYFQHGTYGKVLSSIIDATGKTITITYTTTSVTLTKNNRTVTYTKVSQNGKELLSQVTDPLGRVTTYDYSIKSASFNLQGTTPSVSNPYAILTGITHPTGAKSVYVYETFPVTRYIGASAVNQAYRISTRSNEILYSGAPTEVKNLKTITYTGDMGSSYSTDMTFAVMINDGLTLTTFDQKKDYIDTATPSAYYNTRVISAGGTLQRVTDYTYDEVRRLPSPNTITSKTIDTAPTPDAVSEIVTTSRVFDNYGNITSFTDELGLITTSVYDATTHLLSSVTKPVNATQTQFIEYVRNTQGSVIQMTVKETNAAGALLQKINYESFDAYGNILTTRIKDTGRDIVTATEFNVAHQYAYPTKQTLNVTDVDGISSTIVTQAEYDLWTGQLTTYTDGKLNVTTYEYDALDRIKQATLPDLSTVILTYDDANNKMTVTDETGIKTITSWNPLGWKLENGIDEVGVYKAKTKFGYDSYGRMIWNEDALANRTQMQYDNWRRQSIVTYADGFSSETQYDDIANTKTTIDPELNQYRETYDKLGRVVKKEEIKLPANVVLAEYVYDASGNVLQSKDAKGYITTFGYDIQSRLMSVINPKLEETKYTYNMVGDLVEIKFPDLKTIVKQYDEIGRMIKKTDPKLQVSKYYYDANNNLLKQIDRKGKQFNYEYTDRNFLWKKKILNQPSDTITFGYDASGKRTSMTDQTGTTSYAYKPTTGELNQVTYPDGKTIQYVYDAAGNRKQLTDPFGVNVYYSYDARNRLKDVGLALNDFEAEYGYYKNGLLKTIAQRNGVTSSYTYDGMSLDTLLHRKADGTILNAFDYGYDANRNQTSIVENGSAATFTYDELNRIASSSKFNESYTYDNRGNRQTMQSNQLVNLQDNDYWYDDRDQLTQVTTEDGTIVHYKYNGDGLLYERTENGSTTRYYYDGTNVIAEGTVTGGVATLKARYIRGNGLIAQQDNSLNKAYYLSNGHGDVVELRDSTGNTRLNQYSYDIWGNPIISNENIYNPFRYSGELWDKTTSLQYLRARWYDPSDGRFVNEDSYEGQIDNPLTLNLYTYVHNNPLVNIDPTGHWCTSADGRWSHPGACHDASSTWSSDLDHLGETELRDGKEHGWGFNKWQLSVEDKYILWVQGDNDIYTESSPDAQKQMKTWLFQGYMEYQISNGFPDFVAGYTFDFAALSDPEQTLLLGMKNSTTLWDIKTTADAKVNYNFNGERITAYRDPNTGLYWAKDMTGHADKAYKVFKLVNNELRWVADADKYGNYMPAAHKSPTGMRIKIK